MTEWQGRETTGGYEEAPIADYGVDDDRTDLHRVGFVFLRTVMLMMIVKLVR